MKVFNLFTAAEWQSLQFELNVVPFTYSGATSDRTQPNYYRYDVADSPEARKDVLKDGPLLYRKLFASVKAKLPALQNYAATRVYYNRQYYGMEANIHRDCPVEFKEDLTVVVAVSPTWNTAHGGETLVFDAAGEYFARHVPNSCVMFPSAISHKANYISKLATAPRTVLTFKCRPISAIETALSETNYSAIAHGKEKFQTHLLRVGYACKALGTLSEAAVNAAFFHSVYSTEYFKLAAPMAKEQVIAAIGEEAEKLVAKFCGLPRVELLEGKHGEELKIIAEVNARLST